MPFWNASSHAHCFLFYLIFVCMCIEKVFAFNSFCLLSIWGLLPCTAQSCSFTRKETGMHVLSTLVYRQPQRSQAVFQNSSVVICGCRTGWGESMQTPSTAQQVLGLNLVLSFRASGELSWWPPHLLLGGHNLLPSVRALEHGEVWSSVAVTSGGQRVKETWRLDASFWWRWGRPHDGQWACVVFCLEGCLWDAEFCGAVEFTPSTCSEKKSSPGWWLNSFLWSSVTNVTLIELYLKWNMVVEIHKAIHIQ